MKPIIIFITCLVQLLIYLTFPSQVKGQTLEEIYDPVFVGRPNNNAFNGLVQLPDGELRHYGFEGPWFTPEEQTHYYKYSRDNGLSWNRQNIDDPDLFTGENRPPAAKSPYSGYFIRVISTADNLYVMRSSEGIDGPYKKNRIDTDRCGMIRQPVFLNHRERILVTCSKFLGDIEKFQSFVYYSDDDGYTWNKTSVPIGPVFKAEWPHEKPRWQNYALEPTIAELNDGSIWMLLRTSMDNLYESFSTDGGATWTKPEPSRFYSTLTMPTFFRLKDGRLILFFNSSTPLPEEDRTDDDTIREEQKTGLWEDVFTNRDVIHAAISDDDGKTWTGFRELYLNPLRNEEDFATRGGIEYSLDKSVHQSQAVELPHGKVLLAFGQHPLVRAMIIFDPDILYETTRCDDFSGGLDKWSTFQYIDGIKGHCAYNRVPGPGLVTDPDDPNNHVLHIRHQINPELVNNMEGAVWNFPAALKGSFTTNVYMKPEGKGGRISLSDRWFNPSDTLAYRFAMYNFEFDGEGNTNAGTGLLTPGKWNEVTFEWDNLQSGECRLKVNGEMVEESLPLNFSSVNGINYVHFQSEPILEDLQGYLIRSVKARAFRN